MSQVKLGEAFVSLKLKDGLTRSIDGVQGKMARLRRQAFFAGRDIGRVGGSVQNVGRSVSNLGKQVVKLGTAFGGLAAISSMQLKSFQESMNAVKAVTGAVNGEFAGLEKQAAVLGRTTSFTAREIAALQLQIARTGKSSKEIQDITGSVLKLARAAGTEAPEAAQVLLSTLNAFQKSSGQAARVADTLVKASNSASTTVLELGNGLSYAAAGASGLQISLAETAAALGLLQTNGLDASTAGTSLRRVLAILAGESEKIKNTFGVLTQNDAGGLRSTADVLSEIFASMKRDGLGAAQQAAKLTDVFGLLGATPARILGTQAQQFKELTATIKSSKGEAQRVAKIMNSGIVGAFDRARSAIEGLSIAFAKSISPDVIALTNKLSEKLNDLADVFDRNPSAVKNFARAVALVAAGGALLVPVGAAITAIGTGIVLAGVGVSSAVTAAASSVSLLAAGAAFAGKTLGLMALGLARIGAEALGAGNAVGGLSGRLLLIGRLFSSLAIADAVTRVFKETIGLMGDMVQLAASMTAHFKQVGSSVLAAGEAIMAAFGRGGSSAALRQFEAEAAVAFRLVVVNAKIMAMQVQQVIVEGLNGAARSFLGFRQGLLSIADGIQLDFFFPEQFKKDSKEVSDGIKMLDGQLRGFYKQMNKLQREAAKLQAMQGKPVDLFLTETEGFKKASEFFSSLGDKLFESMKRAGKGFLAGFKGAKDEVGGVAASIAKAGNGSGQLGSGVFFSKFSSLLGDPASSEESQTTDAVLEGNSKLEEQTGLLEDIKTSLKPGFGKNVKESLKSRFGIIGEGIKNALPSIMQKLSLAPPSAGETFKAKNDEIDGKKAVQKPFDQRKLDPLPKGKFSGQPLAGGFDLSGVKAVGNTAGDPLKGRAPVVQQMVDDLDKPRDGYDAIGIDYMKGESAVKEVGGFIKDAFMNHRRASGAGIGAGGMMNVKDSVSMAGKKFSSIPRKFQTPKQRQASASAEAEFGGDSVIPADLLKDFAFSKQMEGVVEEFGDGKVNPADLMQDFGLARSKVMLGRVRSQEEVAGNRGRVQNTAATRFDARIKGDSSSRFKARIAAQRAAMDSRNNGAVGSDGNRLVDISRMPRAEVDAGRAGAAAAARDRNNGNLTEKMETLLSTNNQTLERIDRKLGASSGMSA